MIEISKYYSTEFGVQCNDLTMSFFGLFGGKKEKGPTTGEAIQKLRETEQMLLKKQDYLEKKIELELDTARKNGTKNKRGQCLMCIFTLCMVIA